MSLLRLARPISVLAVAATGVLLLAGCTAGDPQNTESPRPTSSASTEPTAPEESPAPEPTDDTVVSQEIGLDCGELITAEQMYTLDANFTLLENAEPADDTKAAQIAGMDGLVCQWQHGTSGLTIDVAVARLTDDELTALKNLAVTESTQVPTYGEPPIEGYFSPQGDEGEAQIFTGSYWLTLRSVTFLEPGDVIPLADAAMGNLPE